jgi:TetR/AcrR family transcriptional regulator, cholesterol catabolism regulator
MRADESDASRVQVAARLFAEKGYSATTTREISRALGITNGTFYYHYSSKEELLVRICNTSLDRIIDAVSHAVSKEEDPRGRIEALVHTHVQTMLLDQELHKTMLTELRSLNGSNLNRVRAQRDVYSNLVRETIVQAQDAGTLRQDVSAPAMTLLLLNMLNWTIFWFNPQGSMSPEEIARFTASVFLAGAIAR